MLTSNSSSSNNTNTSSTTTTTNYLTKTNVLAFHQLQQQFDISSNSNNHNSVGAIFKRSITSDHMFTHASTMRPVVCV